MIDSRPRRRQVIALLLSGVFPGLGQFYNRQPLKGGVFLVIGLVVSWILGRMAPADPLALAGQVGDFLIPGVVLLAIWLWSLIDAWRTPVRSSG